MNLSRSSCARKNMSKGFFFTTPCRAVTAQTQDWQTFIPLNRFVTLKI